MVGIRQTSVGGVADAIRRPLHCVWWIIIKSEHAKKGGTIESVMFQKHVWPAIAKGPVPSAASVRHLCNTAAAGNSRRLAAKQAPDMRGSSFASRIFCRRQVLSKSVVYRSCSQGANRDMMI